MPRIKFLGMLLMGGPRLTVGTWLSPVTLTSANARCVGDWSLVTGSELSADTYRASSHQLANAGRFCNGNK